MRERWPLSIVGEGLRAARLAPPQVWAELPLKRCHAQAVRASMLLRLRQEPPTVAEIEGSRRTVTTRNRFSPRVGTGVSGSSFRASRMHISSQASVRSAPIIRMDGADRSGEQLKFF